MKICIIGAGLGGLGAAIALSTRGHEVEVFEQAASLTNVGAGIQLSPNAMQVLSAYGLQDMLRDCAFQPETAVIRHYKSGKTLLETPLGKSAEQRYGQPYLHIHRADLIDLLHTEALANGAKCHFNSPFINRQAYDCDLLIGADGIKSKVQACLFGETSARWTGQVAWRATVPVDKLPPNLIAPKATVWRGPNKHVVTYLIRGGKLVNLVAVKEQADWADESWRQTGDVSDLHTAFAGWHVDVTALLSAVEEVHLWGLFDRAPLLNWSKGKTTLLGDACHPMLPFMAQGGAMALEDGWVLADQLTKHASVQDALKVYQAIRKPRTSALQKRSTANTGLFHMHGGIHKPINSAKLKIASLLPILALRELDSVYGYKVTSY